MSSPAKQSYAWPTREQWAAKYTTVYSDDLAQIEDQVPELLDGYATYAEVAVAVAELRTARKVAAAKARQAIAAARTVLPEYAKPRRGADGLAYVEAIEKLDVDQAILIYAADQIRDRCTHLRQLIRELEHGYLPGAFIRSRAGKVDAPTYAAIIGRYCQAVKAAREAYTTAITSRVPDDAAWQRELDRRARIEAGPLVTRVGAA